MADNTKDVNLIIRTKDLSSKPLNEIGDAVTKLEKAVSDLEPASRRGEVSLAELQRVAGKLEQALRGLGANQAIVKRFNEISAAIDSGKKSLTEYQAKVEEIQKTIAATGSTKELSKSLGAAQRDVSKQEQEITKNAQALDKLRVSAQKAGLDLNDLAASHAKVEAEISRTEQVYARVNAEIDAYDANQRQAAEHAMAAANAQALAAYRLSQAEKESAGAAAFEKKRQEIERLNAEAVRLRQSSDYVKFWTDTLDAADQQASDAAAQLKELNAFQEIGKKAEQSAKAFSRAGTEMDQLAAANKQAGASVRAIIDPQNELIKTLDGMETAVKRGIDAQKQFETQIKSTGQTTVDIKDELDALGRVQSNAAGIAALIERFRNTRSAAADAANEMRQARQEVLQYARAVQGADAPNEQLVQSLREAEARLAAAESRYKQFAAAANKMRGDLAGAGVNMRDLSGEMQRVENVARGATNTINQLAAATEKAGVASGKASKGFNLFTSNGRTTLSLFQRLKGEVLALTATYVGLYGAIDSVGKILDSVQNREAAKQRLSIAFGADQVGPMMKYMEEQANRLGIPLETVEKSFTKVAVSAQKAGVSVQGTKALFESFSEAGKVLNLTADEMSGLFLAVDQVFSKGSVQAEELRGQIGERLSGAMYDAAKAAGVTTKTFGDWMKEGKVTSDFMLVFANFLRNEYSGALGDATKNTASEIARFETQITNLKRTVADSGFLQKFTELVKRLADYFASADGQKFAQGIGAAATTIASVLIVLVSNIDAVQSSLEALATYFVVSWVSSFVKGLITVGAEFKVLSATIAAEGLTIASTLNSLIGLFGAFSAGFAVGTFLNQFDAVKKAGVYLVTFLAATWKQIVGDAQLAVSSIVWWWERQFTALYNIVARTTKLILEALADFAKKLGMDTLAKSLTEKASAIGLRQMETWAQRTAVLRKQIEDEQKAIAAIRDQMIADINNPPKEAAAPVAARNDATKGQTAADPAELQRIKDELAKLQNQKSAAELQAEESAAKKRVTLAKQVADEIGRIELEANKKSADTLADRLALVDEQYAGLEEKIKELGGAEGAAAEKSLAYLKERLKLLAEMQWEYDQQKKSLDEIKLKESEINDRVQVRDAMIAAENAKRRAGLITADEAKQNIAKITQSANGQIAADVTATIKAIDTALQSATDPKIISQLQGVKANLESIRVTADAIPYALISQEGVLKQWANGLTDVADKFAEAAAAGEGLGGAFEAAGAAFKQFAADFLREIAMMILKQMILRALQSNPYTAGAAGAISAFTKHSGGMINSGMVGYRAFDPAWVGAAPRYHSGGMVGLRPDEVPAILQTGEEVLSRNDPRNAKNGGRGGAAATQVKVINAIDPGSFISEGLNSPEGQQAVLNFMRANRV